MGKISMLDEDEILRLADKIQLRGQKWFEEIKEDTDYIYNNRPLIEITSKSRCQIHLSRELGHVKMRVPFFWKGKESKSMIMIPLKYCLFCRKFFVQEDVYDKYRKKGEFLCRLVKAGIIINDLTEEQVVAWESKGDVIRSTSLLSIDKKSIGHLLNVEKKRTEIPVICPNGEMIMEDIPVYISKNTGCCYVYTETINRLKQKGIILCRLIKATQLLETDSDFKNLNTESIIHQFGYNVSATNDLSSEQRKRILLSLVTQNIVSVDEIKNHLAFLINVNKEIDKMQSACAKWKEDFGFLDSIEKGLFEQKQTTELIMKNIVCLD